MINEFRQFILRGNVVDLAVALVIGVAFVAVVTAFVEDFVTPLIAAFGGQPDFSALTFEINGSVFRYGHFINSVLSFLIVTAVIFFVVVRPMNAWMARSRTASADPAVRRCPECLSEIPLEARRCAFCTTAVPA
jgi:large conductance mechanosensitive channel